MALIMDADTMSRALVRMAHQIAEKNPGIENVVLMGVRTRGVPLAERIAVHLMRIEGRQPEVIPIDIEPYRDDREHPKTRRDWGDGALVHGKKLILVDDVLYTGRTVRAALDLVVDAGRPQLVQLAVLVDRGHRELPIRADYVGKNIPTSRHELVRVLISEVDGEDAVHVEKEGIIH